MNQKEFELVFFSNDIYGHLLKYAQFLHEQDDFQGSFYDTVTLTYSRLIDSQAYIQLKLDANLSPWLRKCVWNTYRNLYRNTQKRETTDLEPLDNFNLFKQIEDRDYLMKLLEGLTEKQQKILYDRFVNQATLQQLIKDYHLNITRQRLSQKIKAWVRKLKAKHRLLCFKTHS